MKPEPSESTNGVTAASEIGGKPASDTFSVNFLKRAAARLGRRFGASSVSFLRIPETGDEPELLHEWTVFGAASNGQPRSGVIDKALLNSLTDGRVVSFDEITDGRETGAGPTGGHSDTAAFAPYVSNGKLAFVLAVRKASPHEWEPQETAFLRDAAERIFLRLEKVNVEPTFDALGSLDEAVLSSLDEGIFIVDKGGLLLSINPAAQRILGWKFEELRGKPIHDAVHYKHRDGQPFPFSECPLMNASRTGQSSGPMDCTFIRKDGTFVEVACTASPLVKYGYVTGLIVVFRDNSERKMAERRLRESEERFVKFMQNLPGLAWIKDSHGRYIFANDAAVKAFGKKRHELYGKTDFEVFAKEVASDFVKNDRRAVQGGELQTIETLADEAGEPRHSIVNKFLIPTDQGNPLIGGIAIDITEQIQLQAHQDFLFSISEKIRVSRDAEQLLAEIAQSLGEYLGLHRCLFNEIDLDNDLETVHRDYSRTGESVAGKHKISTYSPASSQSMAAGQTVVNRDAKVDPRTADLYESVYGPASERSYVTVPMLREGRWVASLWCSDDKPRNWTPQEIALVENIAERTWAAVERTRSEIALRESEDKYRTIFESIDEGFVIVEMIFDDDQKPIDYRFLEANPAFPRLTGLPEDALGHTARELIPDLEEFWFETYGRVALTGKAVRFEHFSDPMDRWFDVYASRVGGPESRRVAIVFDNITERKATERALRRSEERYRGLINQTVAGVAEADLTGNIIAVNDRYCKILGRTREQLLGLNIQDITHPVDFEENNRKLRRLLQAGENFDIEKRYIRPDGSTVWVYNSVFAVSSLDGRPYSIVAVVIDVTERREAEEALRKSEERYRAVVESQSEMLCRFRVDGTILFVNEAYAKSVGSTAEELRNSNFWNLVIDGDHEDVRQMLATLSPDNPEVQIENRFETVAGLRWTLWTNRALTFDENGKSFEVQSSGIDITDRKLVEDALRKSEEEFRTMANAAPALVWVSEPSGKITYFNERWYEYTGQSQGSSIDVGWREALHPEDMEKILPIWERCRESGEVYEGECRYRRHDGEYRWHTFRALPRRSSDGTIESWYGVGIDVHEERTARERLRVSEERYRALTELSPQFVFLARNDGHVTYVNQFLCDFTGKQATELLGDDWTQFVRSDVRDQILDIWRTALAEGTEYRAEIPFLYNDGSYRTVYARAQPIRDENDSVIYWIGTAVDIEDRIAAETRLRESEEKFSKAFKASPLVLTISSLETGNLLEVNDTFVDVTGYSREEAIGRSTIELGLWANPPDREAELELVRTRGHLSDLEYQFRTREGRLITGLLSAERVDIGGTPCALTVIQDVTDRKLAAEKLSESEERFRLATDAVQAVIYDWNIIEDTIERSAEVQRLLGIENDSPETQTNAWWRTRLHPDDAERSISLVEGAIASGAERFEDEYRIRHRDGNYIWVNDTGLLIRDEKGRAVRCVGSVTDITERKRAEEALRESEQRFRYSSDAAPVLIWMSNVSGGCTWFNKRWLEFTGRTMEQEIGYGWTEGIHPDDRERCMSAYYAGLEARQEFSMEYRLRRADGEYRWVFETGVPRVAPGGEFLGLIGSCVDIHGRRIAEAALRESEERLSLAQIAGNVGVWDWDIVADRTYWSETMWSFYDEEPSTVNPDNEYWSSHLHDEDREAVRRRLEKAVASTDTSYRDEFRIKGGGGKVVWLEAIAKIVRDESGRAVRMYGVNIDITERKLSEERIRRSERQLRLITNSTPALIAYIDRKLKYRFVNERYAEWFGTPTGTIIGKKVREVVGEKAFKSIKPMMMSTLSGRPESFQSTLQYKDAGKRYVQVSYIPDVAEDGTVRGLYSLVSDLTEWKRSEELLKSSEQRVAMLMETVSDYAIFSIGAGGRIETWNVGAENIFGYKTDEILGQPFELLYPPPDREAGVPGAEMKDARRDGKATEERWLVRKGGSRFFASGVMTPLRIGRTLSGYVKIVSDHTDKKTRAELLQRAHDELELRVRDRTRDLAEVNEALRMEIEERERSEAVKIGLLHRIVSAQETERQRIARDIHDQLGQRLTALRLKLSALSDAFDGSGETKQRIERLQEIARLLDSEVSFLASELRPNTLDDLGLEEALRAHAGDWARHYEIEMDFHSNGLSVKRLGRDTEIHLYRIAQEALNNIAKHAKATSVNVLLERTGDTLVLIVEDNGAGFDPKSRSTARRARGGLGLMGMHERASLIGASIEIESIPGKGTTVFVRLPLTGRRQKEKK